MGWLGDSSHRGQGQQAWTTVGLQPRYPRHNNIHTQSVSITRNKPESSVLIIFIGGWKLWPPRRPSPSPRIPRPNPLPPAIPIPSPPLINAPPPPDLTNHRHYHHVTNQSSLKHYEMFKYVRKNSSQSASQSINSLSSGTTARSTGESQLLSSK